MQKKYMVWAQVFCLVTMNACCVLTANGACMKYADSKHNKSYQGLGSREHVDSALDMTNSEGGCVGHTASKLDMVEQELDEFDEDMQQYHTICSKESESKKWSCKAVVERLGSRMYDVCFLAYDYVLGGYLFLKRSVGKYKL